jgi:hypothetical protein
MQVLHKCCIFALNLLICQVGRAILYLRQGGAPTPSPSVPYIKSNETL